MKLHWLHADCLNAEWIDPAGGPAVFVFDDRQLEAENWSLKRLGFVYECLLELPGVEIWRGPTAETLALLAQERDLESILTVRTPDPWLQAQSRNSGGKKHPGGVDHSGALGGVIRMGGSARCPPCSVRQSQPVWTRSAPFHHLHLAGQRHTKSR